MGVGNLDYDFYFFDSVFKVLTVNISENVIKDGLLLHFVSSMISGFVTTVFSMPVDIVKTR